MLQNYAITTVVTPSTSFLLTTKEHVRDDLNIASGKDDAYLDRLIASQSKAAEQYCNRVFAKQTYQDTIRPQRDSRPYFLPNGRSPMFVRRTPLISVASVTENGVLLNPPGSVTPDYEVDTDNGYIYRLDEFGYPKDWPAYAIVIQYDAGYTLPKQGKDGETFTLPLDLEEAVIRMVKARYLARESDPYVKSENIPGVYEITRWIPSGDTGNMTPDITDILDNYRIPAMA